MMPTVEERIQAREARKLVEATMAPYEMELCRFLLNKARNGNLTTLNQLLAVAQEEFPVCDMIYIRKCVVRIGQGLPDPDDDE